MNWLVCLSTSPSLPLLDSRSDDNFERFDVNRASASRSNSSNSLLIRVFEQVYFTDENEEKWKKRIASIKLRSPSRRRINRLSNYWNSGICLTFFTSANKGQVGPISRACRKFKAELTQRRSLLLLLFSQKLLLFHHPDHYYSPTFNVSKSQTTSRVSELVSSFFPLSLPSFSSLSSNLAADNPASPRKHGGEMAGRDSITKLTLHPSLEYSNTVTIRQISILLSPLGIYYFIVTKYFFIFVSLFINL